jgi:heptaprenyl diphosphate synthase
VLASLVGGTLMNPAFWLALSGGAASVFTMVVARRFGVNLFSVVGLGLLGAFAHLLAQVAVAGALVVGDQRILILLPSMLLSGVLTGLVIGYASYLIIARLTLMK